VVKASWVSVRVRVGISVVAAVAVGRRVRVAVWVGVLACVAVLVGKRVGVEVGTRGRELHAARPYKLMRIIQKAKTRVGTEAGIILQFMASSRTSDHIDQS